MRTFNVSVHQCPYCELRFEFLNEVRDHVIIDHPGHAEAAGSVRIVSSGGDTASDR